MVLGRATGTLDRQSTECGQKLRFAVLSLQMYSIVPFAGRIILVHVGVDAAASYKGVKWLRAAFLRPKKKIKLR